MIATPEHAIPSDADERLQRVVLEDEAVLAELDVGPDKGLAGDVARGMEALRDRFFQQPRAHAVELSVGDARRRCCGARIESRSPAPRTRSPGGREGAPHSGTLLDAECDDLVVGVVREVLVGDLGKEAVPTITRSRRSRGRSRALAEEILASVGHREAGTLCGVSHAW